MRFLFLVLASVLSPCLALAQLPQICQPADVAKEDIKECKSGASGSCEFKVKVVVTGTGLSATCRVEPLAYKLICVRRANDSDKPVITWRLDVDGEGAKFGTPTGIFFPDSNGDMPDFENPANFEGRQGSRWATTGVDSVGTRAHRPKVFNKEGNKACAADGVSAQIVSIMK